MLAWHDLEEIPSLKAADEPTMRWQALTSVFLDQSTEVQREVFGMLRDFDEITNLSVSAVFFNRLSFFEPEKGTQVQERLQSSL